MSSEIDQLGRAIEQCMRADRPQLRSLLQRTKRRMRAGEPFDRNIERLRAQVEQSKAHRARRVLNRPTPHFSGELPIHDSREAIVRAIIEHRVIVVSGETGSGKTTQLPQMCLDAGRGIDGVIGHTQPRRIAARTVAARIAEELRTPLGTAVGYKMRFADTTNPDVYIKLMTDGILLAELQHDRELRRYDTIIIDEAHERSLNIDFLLGYVKHLLPRRPDLKVIITSATIDTERFSAHFGGAPIIEVAGRMFHVEHRYRPLATPDPDEPDRDQIQGILAAVRELERDGPGDVLIFLASEREIRDTAEALRNVRARSTEVLPLYARLSMAEQAKVFKPHAGRRIVLATNVAETSLTVPGIRYVIDAGTARISRFSATARVQRLPIEPISQASANQRAGRCGRVRDGICIRLYSEADFGAREEFTAPEILRTNLASVILRMKALQLGDLETFPFVEPPRRRAIAAAYDTLRELDAVNEQGELTAIGRELSEFPIDPRLARTIIAARESDCVREMLIIAAARSIRDPRMRPMDAPQSADEAHARFDPEDNESDFLWYLNLWHAYHEILGSRSPSKLRKWCRDNFIAYTRMREWLDIHIQLHECVRERSYHINKTPASPDTIHRALLTGLLSHVGRRTSDYDYAGAHGMTVRIFPGSSLHATRPGWIMAAELAETTQLWARCAASINPTWIESAAKHLVTRKYQEAHWVADAGKVMAYETVRLYGLEIVSRRRVNYGPINPQRSRELFIMHGLVELELQSDAPFMQHNRKLFESVRALEHKARRMDLLRDPMERYQFFARLLPADVYDAQRLHSWRKQAERSDPQVLFMQRSDVAQADATVDESRYPDQYRVRGLSLPLRYRFEPGDKRDGVTLRVPAAALPQIDHSRLDDIVPGHLAEKIEALIRTLPKECRRVISPTSHYAQLCAQHIAEHKGPLIPALTEALRDLVGIDIPTDAWRIESIPQHLRINLEVLDDSGEVLASGRDVAALREMIGTDEQHAMLRIDAPDGATYTAWTFGDLSEQITTSRGGVAIDAHPVLIDNGDSVSIALITDRAQRESMMRAGLRRLILLELADNFKFIAANLPGRERILLLAGPLMPSEKLMDQALRLIVDRAFLSSVEECAAIRSEAQFRGLLKEGREHIWQATEEVAALVLAIMKQRQEIAGRLDGAHPPAWESAVADMRWQLHELMRDEFLVRIASGWLHQYPRYLRAMVARYEKLARGGHVRDAELSRDVLVRTHQFVDARTAAGRSASPTPGTPGLLEHYGWLLQEYRVAVFAQDLGTAVPISPRRLDEAWKQVREA